MEGRVSHRRGVLVRGHQTSMDTPGFGPQGSAEMNGAGRGLGAMGQGGVGGPLEGKRDPSQVLKEDETPTEMGRCVVKSELALLAA